MTARVATGVLAAWLIALAIASANAAEGPPPDRWPTKPVHVIVPSPAGGPTDLIARTVCESLSATFGVPFVIENKPGASGFIGTADVAKAPADGYTLLVSSGSAMAINPLLYKTIPYDSERDFAPVSLLVTVPLVVVINPKVLPVDDLPALVKFLKANPAEVNYASSGNGGPNHLAPEYFKYRTGTFMTHIPFQGTTPALNALLGGQVHLMFISLLNGTPLVKSGKLRMLAVTTAQRLPEFPEVPTVNESLGMKDFDASSWFAMYAPARTPAQTVERLSAEVGITLKQPIVANRLVQLGAVPIGSSPRGLAAFQRNERDKWGTVIQRAKITHD